MQSTDIINQEYYPTISQEELISKSRYHYSVKELSGWGSGFEIMAAEVVRAGMSAGNSGGLYRCVFPDGVIGKLAAFHDGSGLTGTIVNSTGIAGQARWCPVGTGEAIASSLNPVVFATAMAMMNINQKLDDIQSTQKEMIEFLRRDKETKLEGTLNWLIEIQEQYQYKGKNKDWKQNTETAVSQSKAEIAGNIKFYQDEVHHTLKNKKPIHIYQDADQLKQKLDRNFKYYQLSIYIYAFATFLEIILGENFTQPFLNHMIEKVRDYSYQYRVDYSKCYEQLEDYMKGTLQSVALSGIGNAGKAAGRAIGKIPVIRKAPIDDALVSAGKQLKHMGSQHGKSAMKDFMDNSDAGVQVFVQNIEAINEICNKPVEMIFDQDEVYLCEMNEKTVI